ncbi:MAG: ABC transporter permease [archaeon]
MKKLFFEQYKNFKILFRNLSSLLLLVIGPLVLILLIGFAYSGEGIHSINIGIISDDYSKLEPALANFSTFGTVKKYDKLADCTQELARQNAHICLEFSKDFMQGDVPTGTIIFYYDNSKKALSNKIVDVISDFFGVAAEKISIDSAKTIFSNIQDMVVYIKDRNDDLNVLVNESQNIKNDLLARKEKLIEVRDEFSPSYEKIKKVQARLTNLSESVDADYEEYLSSLESLKHELTNLRTSLALFSSFDNSEIFYYFANNSSIIKITDDIADISENITYYNLRDANFSMFSDHLFFSDFNQSVFFSQDEIHMTGYLAGQAVASIDNVIFKSSMFENSTDTYFAYLEYQKQEFDTAVGLLDTIKILIDADIDASDNYITKIEAASVKVALVQEELYSNIGHLDKINPDLAEKLISPILQSFEPLLPDVENVQIAFPGMLTIIIIFISILFANIVTLSEINSKAFYRNLIAPVDTFLFISGLIITNIIVAFFQVSVLLAVAQLSFHVNVLGNILPLLGLIFILVLLFTCIGMLLAVLIRNEQSSILTATFSALGIFLFSDAVTPLETMPQLAAAIAAWNPFVIAAGAFRKVLIYQIGFVGREIIILSLYALAVFILLIMVKKKIET